MPKFLSKLLPAVIICLCAMADAAVDLKDPALPCVEWLQAPTHDPLEFVNDGRSPFVIVGRFAEESSVRGPRGETLQKFNRHSVRRAADVLQEAFERCTGRKPDVLDESDASRVDGRLVIALGETKWSARLGMKPSELPREGFEVRTFEGGVCIAGMDGFRIDGCYDIYNWACGRLTCNGTEYGAIDFVERFLGVRKFCSRGKDLWTVMPRCDSLTIPPCAYRDHPRYWTRWPLRENWRGGISSDFFGGEAPSPFVLAKAHPDRIESIFYRDPDGRLWQDDKNYGGNFFDITNPDFADILVDDFKAYFANQGVGSYWGTTWAPTTRYLWFGQCDRGVKLDTAHARALARENPCACDAMSEVYGNFYARLGERCQKAFPDRTLVVMAYSSYLFPPRKVAKFPDNVQVLACLGTPALVRSARYRKAAAAVYEGWNRLCSSERKCVPYTYDLNYNDAGVIAQFLRGRYEAEFLRWSSAHTAPHLVYTCLARGKREDGTFGNELSSYLVFRALWNPDYDVAAATADFFRQTCGAAAAVHLLRAYDLMAARWESAYLPAYERGPQFRRTMDPHNCFRSIPYTEFAQLYTKALDREVCAALGAELDAAESKVQADGPCRARLDAIVKPLRKALQDAEAYQNAAGGGRIRLPAGQQVELPALNVYKVAGGLTPRGVKMSVRRDADGLSFSLLSRYAPFGADKPEGECHAIDVLLAPGEHPAGIYRFSFDASGRLRTGRKQLDPPRPPEDFHDARRATVSSTADDARRRWTAELFVPWAALDERPPKEGDVWRMNVVMTRPNVKRETSSLAPTLGDIYREELYTTVDFKEDEK